MAPPTKGIRIMKITVLGATGLIGSRVVTLLRTAGHEVTPAARSAGVDAVTGQGLDGGALAGADVVVDVTNAPSLDAEPVMTFFTAESANLVAAAKAAAVNHIVVLSIVGVDALPDSGYAGGAKVVQEKTVTGSGVPYTIVRATQFHEFTERIVGSLLVDGTYRVPDARIQPISAAEVAAVVAEAAQATPSERCHRRRRSGKDDFRTAGSRRLCSPGGAAGADRCGFRCHLLRHPG